MTRKKGKSFIRRLLTLNFHPEESVEEKTIICRPGQGSAGPFFRFRLEGGILVPVNNFPFDTWESCMGIEGDEVTV